MNNLRSLFTFFLAVISIAAMTTDARADAEIRTEKITDNIYMVVGTADVDALRSGDLEDFSGGNIGVSVGEDGVLIIDAKMAAFAGKIKAAIDRIGGDQPKFIIDTHSHDDHVNGNPEFAGAGTIIAHDNARTRIVAEKSQEYWPVITFDHSLSIHLNGEEIRALHYAAGHTDGDIVVYFVASNVVHMGDLYFSGYLPYVDLDSGGTVQGYMDNVSDILEKIPNDVMIIPGHGPVSTRDDLQTYHRLMRETVALVTEQMQSGRSLAEIQRAGLQDEWIDWAWFLVTPDTWIETIYKSYSTPE
jgi:glyoxylase-like metal-dependent hydrolase (beta-lactamase superfamily II)